MNPLRPKNERARIEALRQYEILDTEPEQSFDDITLLASMWCRTPTALISLIDTDRQWLKSRVGFGEVEIPRDDSICTHAILRDQIFIVTDTHEDNLLRNNRLVLESPFIRFYAGAPLVSPEGFIIGTLCVMDHVTRVLEPLQIASLKLLADQVMVLLGLRQQIGFLTRALEIHRQAAKVILQMENSE